MKGDRDVIEALQEALGDDKPITTLPLVLRGMVDEIGKLADRVDELEERLEKAGVL